MGEREGLAARGQGALKSFVTTEETTLRDAYGRLAFTEPVRFILAATTNNVEILTDTVNRRDPVVRIPDDWVIDISKVRQIRGQLWAQACAELDDGMFTDPTVSYGYAVRLPRHLWGAALADSDQHKQITPMFEVLNHALNECAPARNSWRVTGQSIQVVVKDHLGKASNQEFSRTGS